MRGEDNYIRTYTGRRFWPLDPVSDDVCLEDIAHALAQLCRFTGHSRTFYSVAQHSVLVAELLPAPLAIYGLLHDATEAYLCDLSRPVKHDALMAPYREAEVRLHEVICERFLLDPKDEAWRLVKWADELMLHAELRDLLKGSSETHAHYARGVSPVVPMWPEAAEWAFLRAFTEADANASRRA